MKQPLTRILLALVLPAAALGQTAVVAPSARQGVLEGARRIIAPHDTAIAPSVKDPFHPAYVDEATSADAGSAGMEAPVQARPSVRSERDLLAAMAAGIKPSGSIVIGGEATLIFGQKRVKSGGTLAITFEGVDYALQITAIDRTSFTLRLNREEYTRPIK